MLVSVVRSPTNIRHKLNVTGLFQLRFPSSCLKATKCIQLNTVREGTSTRSENLRKSCRCLLQKSKAPDDICRNPTKYRFWTSSQLYCARLNKLTAEIMLACKWCLILHSLIKSKKIAQHMFFSTLWVRPNGCLYKKRSTFIWTFQLKVNSSSFVICLTQMTHTHMHSLFSGQGSWCC